MICDSEEFIRQKRIVRDTGQFGPISVTLSALHNFADKMTYEVKGVATATDCLEKPKL